MKQLAAVLVACLMLAGSMPSVLAQTTTERVTATDGDAAIRGTGAASAAPGNVTRGGGAALLSPDGTFGVSDAPPPSISVTNNNTPPVINVSDTGYVPEPVYDTGYVDDTYVADDAYVAEDTYVPEDSNPPAETSTVGADVDQDDDNALDARELDLGLDPYNADTDGDGFADGDELFGLGTDPLTWDAAPDAGSGDQSLSSATTEGVMAS